MRRLALAALALALAGCALTTDLDMVRAESTLEGDLSRFYGVEVDDVSCPAEVDIEDGGRFACTATLAGQELEVTAVQEDEEGNVTFEARQAVIDVAAKTQEISAAIGQSHPGTEVRLSCGDQPVLILAPGGTFECTLTERGGITSTVVVTVEDVDGATSFTTGASGG